MCAFTPRRTGHAVQFGRLEIESVDVVQRVAPYDLSLVVSEGVERGPLDMTWQVRWIAWTWALVPLPVRHIFCCLTILA
jgi:hypothetical protein